PRHHIHHLVPLSCVGLDLARQRHFPLVLHELPSERALRSILVVRSAPQPHGFHRRPAPTRHRLTVIKFEEFPRRTTVTRVADKRALPLVALPDRAPHLRRHIALVGTGLTLERSRLGSDPQLP